MSRTIPDDSYPIREFARLTGVNPATLRAWERRYGIIQPLRTPKGHRYFTDEHIHRVNNILHWLEQGYPIRQVGGLLSEPNRQENHPPGEFWHSEQNQLLDALKTFQPRRINDLWNTSLASYPVAVYYQHCLLPVMQHLRSTQCPMVLTRLLEQLLKQRLQYLMAQQQPHAAEPALLVITNHPDGEIEALVRACAIGAAGLRVEYLANILRPQEVDMAAEALNVQAIWIHFMPQDNTQAEGWSQLLEQDEHRLWLSGQAPQHPAGRSNVRHLTSAIHQQVHAYILGCGGRLDDN